MHLIDYEANKQLMRFGTCDLCSFEAMGSEPEFLFTDGEKEWWVDGYYWCYGTQYAIDVNPIQFALWLEKNEVDELPTDYESLERLVDRFNND